MRAVVRSFSVGDKVLTRVPGLRSKLEGSWEGPFVVLDAPSDVQARQAKHVDVLRERECM